MRYFCGSVHISIFSAKKEKRFVVVDLFHRLAFLFEAYWNEKCAPIEFHHALKGLLGEPRE